MEGLRDDESISDDIRRESIETANRFPVSAFLTVYVTLAVFRSYSLRGAVENIIC